MAKFKTIKKEVDRVRKIASSSMVLAIKDDIQQIFYRNPELEFFSWNQTVLSRSIIAPVDARVFGVTVVLASGKKEYNMDKESRDKMMDMAYGYSDATQRAYDDVSDFIDKIGELLVHIFGVHVQVTIDRKQVKIESI